MTTRTTGPRLLAATLVVLAVGACSSTDDGDETADAGEVGRSSAAPTASSSAPGEASESASETASESVPPDFVSDALVVADDETVECAGNLADGDVRSSTAAIISAQVGLTVTAVRLEGTGVEPIGTQGIPLEPGDLGILDFSDQWPMDFPGAENAVDLVDLRIEVGQQVLPLVGFTVTPPGDLTGVVVEYVDDRGDAGAATLPFDVTLRTGAC